MMDIEKFTKIKQREIEQLHEDLFNCKNDFTVRTLMNVINDKKYSIEEAKMKNLGQEIKDKYVCMECDEEMHGVTASEGIKRAFRVREDGTRIIGLMCEPCAMAQY